MSNGDFIISHRPPPKKPRLSDADRLICWTLILLCGYSLFTQPLSSGDAISVAGLAVMLLYGVMTA